MARILVVDDDPSILALERLLLSEMGHEVLLMSTARAALEALQVYDFDLIIVDIMMPELNGFQLVNRLRNNSKVQETPVAFVTAKTDPQDVIRAGELGADFYIMKPIIPDEYMKKITQVFEKHPPKNYSQVNFQMPPAADVKASVASQVCSVSDFGVEILTPALFELDQVVELSTSFFNEIPLKNPIMRVLSVKSAGQGLHQVRLMFQDQDKETVLKIQRWIAYNKVKARKIS